MFTEIRHYIGRFLYVSIAQWLPVSYSPVHLGQQRLRALCAGLMLEYCGRDVNIERRAHFSRRLEIGGHVIILPGVHVGSHSIIGAGSVVTRDIPDWAISGGNPAVVKKYRRRPENDFTGTAESSEPG